MELTPETVTEILAVLESLANRDPIRRIAKDPKGDKCRLCFQRPGEHHENCIWVRAYRLVHPGQALPY